VFLGGGNWSSGCSTLRGARPQAALPDFVSAASPGDRPKAACSTRLHPALQHELCCWLAHAAGSDPTSSSVDALLRRWVAALADAEGTANPCRRPTPLGANREGVSPTLSPRSLRAPVFLLLDALDQFESTPRGRFLTWLPMPLPQRVRLLATAVQGFLGGCARPAERLRGWSRLSRWTVPRGRRSRRHLPPGTARG